MRSFGISIKGRTKNFTLPKSQPLIPLFEAIVNSFHSIEERKKTDSNFKGGHIYIEMERDGQISIDGVTREAPGISLSAAEPFTQMCE